MRDSTAASESRAAVGVVDKPDDFLSAEVGALGEVGSASTGIGPDDDDDDRELDRLLAYCQAGSSGTAGVPTLTESWQTGLGDHHQRAMESDLDLFISNERSRGLDKIRAQLTHAAGVFKDLAHFVSDDNDRLNSVENGMAGARDKTAEAIAQLRKAHKRTQNARKRRVVLWTILVVCALFIVAHLWPSWLLPHGSNATVQAVSGEAVPATPVEAPAHPLLPLPPEKPSFLAAGQQIAFRSGLPATL